MIKRQFYAIEHADNGDDASSSSSSSSSSSLNTSSDLSSAAGDEQDDGAWPGIIEAMTVSVSFLQSLVCVCVAQEACLLKEFFTVESLLLRAWRCSPDYFSAEDLFLIRRCSQKLFRWRICC